MKQSDSDGSNEYDLSEQSFRGPARKLFDELNSMAKPEQSMETLLGQLSIGLVGDAYETIKLGAEGLFDCEKSMNEGVPEFLNESYKRFAQQFKGRFWSEIQEAICGKEGLLEKEKKCGFIKIHVFAATISATIGANVKVLSGMTPLLTLLGVMIARSGLNSFCDVALSDEKKR